MKALPILCVAMIGCTQPQPQADDEAFELALACVEREVPDGTKVSAERARAVVEGCEPAFEDWTRSQIERAFEKPFDGSDPAMVAAYNRELGNKIELMQLRISDGPHQNLPNI